MTSVMEGDKVVTWIGEPIGRVKSKGGRRSYYEGFTVAEFEGGRQICSVRSGDCVLLKSDDPSLPYVAKILSLFHTNGKKMMGCQWFYRPEDTNLSRKRKQRLKPNELFSSCLTDQNLIKSIIDKVDVHHDSVKGSKKKGPFFCLHSFNPKNGKLSPSSYVRADHPSTPDSSPCASPSHSNAEGNGDADGDDTSGDDEAPDDGADEEDEEEDPLQQESPERIPAEQLDGLDLGKDFSDLLEESANLTPQASVAPQEHTGIAASAEPILDDSQLDQAAAPAVEEEPQSQSQSQSQPQPEPRPLFINTDCIASSDTQKGGRVYLTPRKRDTFLTSPHGQGFVKASSRVGDDYQVGQLPGAKSKPPAVAAIGLGGTTAAPTPLWSPGWEISDSAVTACTAAVRLQMCMTATGYVVRLKEGEAPPTKWASIVSVLTAPVPPLATPTPTAAAAATVETALAGKAAAPQTGCLEDLRFELQIVADGSRVKGVPLAATVGLEVPTDLVLRALHEASSKAGRAVSLLPESSVVTLAKAALATKWNLVDTCAFASLLDLHKKNFRKIAEHSIGGRSLHDVRCIIAQFHWLEQKDWTKTSHNRPRRMWACPRCTYVNTTISMNCKVCLQRRDSRLKSPVQRAQIARPTAAASGSGVKRNNNKSAKRPRPVNLPVAGGDCGNPGTASAAKRAKQCAASLGAKRGLKPAAAGQGVPYAGDALYSSFINRVEDHFRKRPQLFEEFSGVLGDYKSGKTTSTIAVCSTIQRLLKGSQSLLEEFIILVSE